MGLRQKNIIKIKILIASFCLFVGNNVTATYDEIEGLLKKSMAHANQVFSGAEFYGSGTKIHKGISFKLARFHIDSDADCLPTPV